MVTQESTPKSTRVYLQHEGKKWYFYLEELVKILLENPDMNLDQKLKRLRFFEVSS